ncbi:ankyrin repeat domain-containing protein [Burkholderia multivorans]|nr:ankyrin repeat domain-containing protein [Burkholderia multivorans]
MNFEQLISEHNKRQLLIELHDASQNGDIGKVKELMEKGVDPTERFCKDFYALREAASFGHAEIVEILIKHGADLHDWNDWALRVSAAGGYLEVVKVLLENGANVHAYNDWAYREAFLRGHTEIAKLLLAYGADEQAALQEDDLGDA